MTMKIGITSNSPKAKKSHGGLVLQQVAGRGDFEVPGVLLQILDVQWISASQPLVEAGLSRYTYRER